MDSDPEELIPSLGAAGVRSYGTAVAAGKGEGEDSTSTPTPTPTPRAARGWARVAGFACAAVLLAACAHTLGGAGSGAPGLFASVADSSRSVAAEGAPARAGPHSLTTFIPVHWSNFELKREPL
jgi:hypothetical protein